MPAPVKATKPKQSQPQQRANIGRHSRVVAPLSTATPEGVARAALNRQLKRAEEMKAQHAEQLATANAQAAAAHLEGYRSNVRANATAYFARDVQGPELAACVNNVVNAFDRHVRAGQEPKRFDVTNTCKDVRYARGIGNGVAPAPRGTSLADQRLPPPVDSGASPHRVLRGAEAQHAERDPQRAEYLSREQERAEQDRLSRARDADNLKRWGLQDPRLYAPCG